MHEHEVVIENAGGWCPYQAEGTYRGYRFYVRCRHDTVELCVASIESGEDPVGQPPISELGEWLVYPEYEPYTDEQTSAFVKKAMDAWLDDSGDVGVARKER